MEGKEYVFLSAKSFRTKDNYRKPIWIIELFSAISEVEESIPLGWAVHTYTSALERTDDESSGKRSAEANGQWLLFRISPWVPMYP